MDVGTNGMNAPFVFGKLVVVVGDDDGGGVAAAVG